MNVFRFLLLWFICINVDFNEAWEEEGGGRKGRDNFSFFFLFARWVLVTNWIGINIHSRSQISK